MIDDHNPYQAYNQLSLSAAVLVYSSGRNAESYATINEVSKDQIVTPGKPLDGDSLIRIGKGLTNNVNSWIEVSKYMLYVKPSACIWWCPSMERTFYCEEASFYYNWPALVFMHCGSGLYVYSLTNNERPNGDTLLYHPGVSHVDPNGRVHSCGLNLPPPRQKLLDEVEEAFLFSPFNEKPSPCVKSITTLKQLANNAG